MHLGRRRFLDDLLMAMAEGLSEKDCKMYRETSRERSSDA